MSTHPLWRPFGLADLTTADDVVVGERSRRPLEVVAYDERWPAAYARIRDRIRAALGDRVLALEHVGSTSVPGLAAKPFVDVDLTVADSADEDAYLPALVAAGFSLTVREPAWDEHRMVVCQDPVGYVHVWPPGAPESRRHLMFRDWLRSHPDDAAAYGALKTELGRRRLTHAMDYNNRKAALVYDVYERIFAADPDHAHDPRPRAQNA